MINPQIVRMQYTIDGLRHGLDLALQHPMALAAAGAVIVAGIACLLIDARRSAKG